MRHVHLTSIIGLTALASGCATTKQVTATYWTEKSGIAVVHHVVGPVDKTEKLSEKQLPSDEIEALGLSKGKYYQVVDAQSVNVSDKPKADTKAKKNDMDGSKDKLAEVTSQLHDLKSQIASVAAQNKRLEVQLNSSSKQPPSQPDLQEEADAPRISQ